MWASWRCGVGSQTPGGAWLLKNAVSTASPVPPRNAPSTHLSALGVTPPLSFLSSPHPQSQSQGHKVYCSWTLSPPQLVRFGWDFAGYQPNEMQKHRWSWVCCFLTVALGSWALGICCVCDGWSGVTLRNLTLPWGEETGSSSRLPVSFPI